MDPLSIATGCASLITTIGSLSLSITSFVRGCREARTDLDRVSRELHSLQTALELIQEDAKDDTKPFPDIIQRHVSDIVTNCNSVVVEIQTCITKYGDGKARSKAAWALNGQGDMQKLRSSLEAHKSALELALDMLTLSATKDIKADTTEIRNNTATIKDDTTQILEEIARLQERLPATAAASNDYILQRFLEDMAAYTESTLDVDGGFSDRASSKALSFIDEGEESSHARIQSDLSISKSETEQPVEVSQVSNRLSTHVEAISINSDPLSLPYDFLPKQPVWKRLPEPQGDDKKARQASGVETLSCPDVTVENLQLDSKPSPELQKIRRESLLPTTPTSLNHNHEIEENQGLGNSNSSSDNNSANSPNLLREQPEEDRPTVQIKDLTPEEVYMIAYGIRTSFDNYVLKLPVPEAMLKAVPRTDHDEYTETRFTFVTCSPYFMAGNRYCLRPTFYTSKPVTKFILALEMSFAVSMHIKQTWKLIHDAIAYAERKIGPDTWRQFRVHIHSRRYTTKNELDFLEKIGAIQDFSIPPNPVVTKQGMDAALTQDTMEVGGRKVQGTMQEYTVQLRADTDRTRRSRSDIIPADVPIQTVVTRHAGRNDNYDHFSHWTKAIQRILDATCIIDMGYVNDHNYEDYKFLYRAWIATKPFKVSKKDAVELVRFDDLIKQTRTLKERLLG
ncbi:uncharacterized protein FIESC28_00978 [Fusarium coffeatum]|uniref:chitin synthase n=1 Tax=Fusarium coffeatum TaxID=231269 RepID=A0A366SC44_9HYPO|nr:uncharacterized protein FIESC28_00978 [Fusarium coffeatum]RBR26195.1 hypothetical protein FIESC28_00978 [Fusarium coffeatum]